MGSTATACRALASVASQLVDADGIWLSFAVSNVLGVAVASAWYQRGTWRGVDVSHGPDAVPSDD